MLCLHRTLCPWLACLGTWAGGSPTSSLSNVGSLPRSTWSPHPTTTRGIRSKRGSKTDSHNSTTTCTAWPPTKQISLTEEGLWWAMEHHTALGSSNVSFQQGSLSSTSHEGNSPRSGACLASPAAAVLEFISKAVQPSQLLAYCCVQ